MLTESEAHRLPTLKWFDFLLFPRTNTQVWLDPPFEQFLISPLLCIWHAHYCGPTCLLSPACEILKMPALTSPPSYCPASSGFFTPHQTPGPNTGPATIFNPLFHECPPGPCVSTWGHAPPERPGLSPGLLISLCSALLSRAFMVQVNG